MFTREEVSQNLVGARGMFFRELETGTLNGISNNEICG